MTKEQREDCLRIIHKAALAPTTMAHSCMPGAAAVAIIPIDASMVMALAKVFKRELTQQTAQSMASSIVSTLTGRAASEVLLGFIPFIGNELSAATAAGITESVGWMIAERFERESKIDPTVLRHAEATFGHDAALEWLNSQCEAISDFRPIDLLETADGRRQVLDVLACIDHGFVY